MYKMLTTTTTTCTSTTCTSDDNQNVCVENGAEAEAEEPEVDITISNVVTNFSVRCHLNLRQIATNGSNVVYKREQQMISMKLRQPRVTASIWSSGKITCTGATTEDSAKCASRKVARVLQKLGFRVKFGSYRIVNVLGSCILPFGIKIHEFSDNNRANASYEPELHPGATYRMKDIHAVLKIFQTGAITITAPSILNVRTAVERIYPLVYEYRKAKPPQASKISLRHIKDGDLGKKKGRAGKNRDEFSSQEESSGEFSEENNAMSSDEDLDEDDYSDKSD